MSLLYVYVHAASACPCCMCVSMLHMRVHAVFPCPCCMPISMLRVHVSMLCVLAAWPRTAACRVHSAHPCKISRNCLQAKFPEILISKISPNFHKIQFFAEPDPSFHVDADSVGVILTSIASAGAYSYDFLLASVGFIPAGCFRRWLPFPLFFSWTWISVATKLGFPRFAKHETRRNFFPVSRNFAKWIKTKLRAISS
jgi:hypothetical protein